MTTLPSRDNGSCVTAGTPDSEHEAMSLIVSSSAVTVHDFMTSVSSSLAFGFNENLVRAAISSLVD